VLLLWVEMLRSMYISVYDRAESLTGAHHVHSSDGRTLRECQVLDMRSHHFDEPGTTMRVGILQVATRRETKYRSDISALQLSISTV